VDWQGNRLPAAADEQDYLSPVTPCSASISQAAAQQKTADFDL
jgi:hypothetical protein